MTAQKNQNETAQSVLVTGATGLLGSHVVRAFKDAGYRVIGLDIAQRDDPDIVVADLTRLDTALELVRDVDHVVHIASLPRPLGYAAEDVYDTNMMLMFNIVEAMERNKINSLIYASSFSVTGFPFANQPIQPAYLPLDAQHPMQALDVYALTKLLGENIVDYWVGRTGGNAVSIRMPWVQTPQIFARDVLPRRDSDDARLDLWAYIDARDAAAAFVQSVQAKLEGHQRFFISAADSYSTHPTADLVQSFYPSVRLNKVLTEYESLICNREAETLIGYQPRHSWRDYDQRSLSGGEH